MKTTIFAVSIVLIFSSMTFADLSSGLIGHWDFNGNATDSSGYGNDGTVGATLTADRFGNPNSAYSFDGISQNIEIQNDPIFELDSSITVSAWIKRDQTTDYDPILGKCGNMPNGTCNFLFDIGGDSYLRFQFYSGGWYTGSSSTTISDTGWHHVAATYDQQNISLYIDGVLSNSTPYSALMPANNENIQIGESLAAWPFDYFDGNIDEVRLYNRALSGSEIQQLSVVPEPISSILFVTGGTLLAGRRYLKRKKTA